MQTVKFFTTGDSVRMAYSLEGSNTKPVLVLSNSIATSMQMWDVIMPDLLEDYRVLRYDMRGHGQSDVPVGAYSADRLGRDVLELTENLGIEKFHFLGLSLGGYVGQWLGVYASNSVDRLILSNTAPYLGPARLWDQAIKAVLDAVSMNETIEMFLHNWFPPAMFTSGNATIEKFRSMLMSINKCGLAGAWAVVRDADMRPVISKIDRPTLVIAGEYDTVTNAQLGREMADAVPDAEFACLPAVHMPHIEYPAEYVTIVKNFLSIKSVGIDGLVCPPTH